MKKGVDNWIEQNTWILRIAITDEFFSTNIFREPKQFWFVAMELAFIFLMNWNK